MMDEPVMTFAAHFIANIRDDFHHRGCTSDSMPAAIRRSHTYKERVILEREQLHKAAAEYIHSQDFDQWSHLFGIDPDTLREAIVNDAY